MKKSFKDLIKLVLPRGRTSGTHSQDHRMIAIIMPIYFFLVLMSQKGVV